MKITKTKFDNFQNKEVIKTTLTNDNNISVSFLNMGAIWHEFLVPNNNDRKNLLLNFPNIKDYYLNPFYLNMAIGRTGGRIKNGTMPLNGQDIVLPTNEEGNNLHGGPNGFNTFFWNQYTKESKDSLSITYYRTITEKEDGYPGDIDIEITYILSNNNDVTICYKGTSNKDTFFNPTCHAYFNLGNSDTILNHNLQINSDYYLEVDSKKIPTGNLTAVTNTPFDFRNSINLDYAIKEMSDTTEKGFDDIFKINKDEKKPIAILKDNDSNSKIKIFSSRNGLVVFSANSFTSNMQLIKGNGKPYMGIALEPQTLSDTHNHKGFGNVALAKGESQKYSIKYKYFK
ncbi:maltose epimerase [Companilactobacillus sp. RD055328]|uniref:aldose epimerase family protein n=1 Tax=Companilactobacillus sp. RD055328 TaxID=2916634 RepID=UPI001FC83E4A|nr:aldose epimerase family protein [Companilactobacillus sp. RD055328]GKQ42377.1 maltose epimerase [Companilactobacillus sp. RD055328]